MSVEEIAPRSGRSSQVKGPLVGEQQGEGSEELAAKVGEGRATLRLKQNGQAVVEQVVSIQSLCVFIARIANCDSLAFLLFEVYHMTVSQ